jgi:hypothetical protein
VILIAASFMSSSSSYLLSYPHLLVDFFWHYSQLDRSRQEYNPTVSISFTEDKEAVRQAFLVRGKLKYRNSQKMAGMVPDIYDPTVAQAFIIPLPLEHQPCLPFLRATRPTLALKTKKLVLKVFWRPDVAGGDSEGDIYAILPSHGVPQITPLGTGNDVREHVTRTQEFANNTDWPQPGRDAVALTPLRQYRMTLPITSKSLTDFKSSKAFVSAIADAMKGKNSSAFFFSRRRSSLYFRSS